MKSIFSNFFRANLVSTLHSFWWFSLFIVFLTPKNLFATDYTITVTSSGTSHYTLNNAALGFTDADDPNITVTWSDKLIFDISTIKSIHPLAIVDQLTEDDGYDVANRVDFVLNNGDGENTVEWNLNGVTPGTYYYICTNHKFMKGTITVVESLSGIDSDGDGVDDNVDVDDDNDGILDIFECGPSTSSENLIQNGDFETWEDFAVSGVHPPADWDQYSSGLQSVENPRDRYPFSNTSAPLTAQSGNIYLRLYNSAGLSQDITTEINKEYTIKFYHAAVFQDIASNGTPDGRIEVYIDDVLEVTTPSIVLADSWQEFTTTFTATSTSTKIGFNTPANTSLHQSGIDNISVTLPSENCEDIDTDGDGLPNRIDPDSDQDSCPDLIEAGYVDPDEPTDGMVGRISNGFTYDGKVKNVDYFTLLDQIDDLDSNGVKDFLEKGSVLSIDLDPLSIDTLEYSTVTFSGQGTTDLDLGTIFYS